MFGELIHGKIFTTKSRKYKVHEVAGCGATESTEFDNFM